MPEATGTGGPTTELGRRADLSPVALAREKAGKGVRPMLVSMAQRPEVAQKADADPSLKQGVDALHEYSAILTTAPFTTEPGQEIPLEGGNPVMLKLSRGGSETDVYDARITAIAGLTEDPQNGRVYEVIVDGKDVIAIPEVALADAQLAAEGDEILKVLPDGKEKQFLEGYLPHLDQRRRDGDPDPTPIPDDLHADITTLYPTSLIQPDKAPEQAPQTPMEKAQAVISQSITDIEKKLKSPELKDKKEREKLEKVLLSLRLAQMAEGPSSAFVTGQALRRLKEANMLTDPGTLDGIAAEAKDAQSEIGARITDPDNGLNDKDRQELKKKFDEEGIVGLVKDKRFGDVPGLTSEIFGDSPPNIKQLLKDIKIPPQLEQALDKLSKEGKHSKLWWILLLLLTSPITVPLVAGLAAGVATIGTMTAAFKGQG